MKISIITPNYNGGRYLETALRSVLEQEIRPHLLEYIVVDGGSTDSSAGIIERYRRQLAVAISGPDRGPADAINKGLKLATGDLIGWINADDMYHPGTLARVIAAAEAHPEAALLFGRCRIVDEAHHEIRRGVTRFKESLFPISSRFTIQSINYISQPAAWFRRSAFEKAGLLRTDLKAAFDYDFTLRLWRHGGGRRIPGPVLSDFRWHPGSISGRHFVRQFREEWEAARADAGPWAPQTWLHWLVQWGIVGCYTIMTAGRRGRAATP